MSIENVNLDEHTEDGDISFSSTLTEEDMRKMSELCDAAHDQEVEHLKAKFSELADSAEKKYELFRYYRYNTHIEMIVRAEDDYGDDGLISIMFDEDGWYNLDGHCSRETFEDILDAFNDLWEYIKIPR